MRNLYLFIWTCMMLAATAKAQQQAEANHQPNNKMLSGTVLSSELSQLYKPNLFDGTANIGIPIYQFDNEGVDYGISFSYHTKGVRVDEATTAIGLHWNLNTIPSITRIVKDLPDEMNVRTDSLVKTIDGTDVPHDAMYIKGKLISYQDSQAELDRPNARYDGEMDEFVVNLGGSGFSFYIGKGFNIFTHPNRRVKVRMLVGGIEVTSMPEAVLPLFHYDVYSPAIEFEIKDENGNLFYFVPSVRDEFKTDVELWDKIDYLQVRFHHIIKWTASRVVFADGREIKYIYSPIEYAQGSMPDYYDYKNYLVRENMISKAVFGLGTKHKFKASHINQLSEVQYPDGSKVSFIYSSTKGNDYNFKLIEEISVSSKNGDHLHSYSNCIRYQLDQEQVMKRWFLKRIKIKSCDDSKSEPYYSFEYNTLALPRRLNSAQDLYGYYNGDSMGVVPNNGSSDQDINIPKHHFNDSFLNYGVSRGYDFQNSKAGILQKISNAYGGSVSFFYGPGPTLIRIPPSNFNPPNYFLPHVTPNGLVIDSIKLYDNYLGEMQKTVFSYSGGQLFTFGGLFHYPEKIDSATGGWTQLIFQGVFLTSHNLINGSDKGYSNVSVKTYAQNQLLSRTDHVFSNLLDASNGMVRRYFKYPISKEFYEYPYTDKQYIKDWEIGLPLSITQYNSNNQIIQRTRNTYNFRSPIYANTVMFGNVKTKKVNSGTVMDYWGIYLNKKVFTDEYVPYTGKALLQHAVTEKYVNDTRFISDSVIYRYDGYDNLKSTVTFDSRKGKTATELVYNYEGDGDPAPPGMVSNPNSHLYKMSVAGLEKVVSIERWKLPPGSSIQPTFGAGLLDAFVTRYDYTDGRLLTKGLYNLYKGQPLSYADYTGNDPGDIWFINPYGKLRGIYLDSPQPNFRPASRVNSFDENGNPQEVQMLGEEVYKAMVWDKKTGQKLAEANCKFSDIGYLNFDEYFPSSAGQTEQGNFKIFPGDIYYGNAANGRNSFMLYNPSGGGHTAGPGEIHGTQTLEAGREYILSYWFVNSAGPLPKLYINDNPVTTQVMSPSYLTGNKSNVQLRFTPAVSGTLKIKAGDVGNTIYIDELRLFPADAQMLSWSYEPLFGVSSETDPSGRITYYEYDEFGRLKLSRDMEGNIISKTEYHINQ